VGLKAPREDPGRAPLPVAALEPAATLLEHFLKLMNLNLMAGLGRAGPPLAEVAGAALESLETTIGAEGLRRVGIQDLQDPLLNWKLGSDCFDTDSWKRPGHKRPGKPR
jgi:hypothetical protein